MSFLHSSPLSDDLNVVHNVLSDTDSDNVPQNRRDCREGIHPTASPPPDESVLRRAGLLQPMSYVSSSSSRTSAQAHSQGVIRSSTVQISNTIIPTFSSSASPSPSHRHSSLVPVRPLSSPAPHATRGTAEPPSERDTFLASMPQSRDCFIFPRNTIQEVGTPEAMSGTPLPPLKLVQPMASSFVPSSHYTNRGSPHFSMVSEVDMDADEDLSTSTYTFQSGQTAHSDTTTTGSGARDTSTSRGHSVFGLPSNLSILLARKQSPNGEQISGGQSPTGRMQDGTSVSFTNPAFITPTNERRGDNHFSPITVNAMPLAGSNLGNGSGHFSPLWSDVEHPSRSQQVVNSEGPNETTSLLHANHPVVSPSIANDGPQPTFTVTRPQGLLPDYVPPDHGNVSLPVKSTTSLWNLVDPNLGRNAIRAVPAVVLGTLLNILDGISYGMIIFPAAGLFIKMGGAGVSMFFVSTVISQLVYSLGGSNFAGANGSMMIEVVPFFHILASTIASDIIGDDWSGQDEMNQEVLATTLVAYALSSLLTGLTFFLLGYLRLGVLIGFFPRHILVGCIGGVGVFLILTGLTVSTRIPSDALDSPTWETIRYFFLDPQALVKWVPPLGLAVLLRVITARWKHQLLFPIYFLIIPTIFYIVVAAAQLDLDTLRADGWLFEAARAGGGMNRWYAFYTYYDLRAVRWTPIWTTLPTQFALLFFNILHPPLNVPALAVSLDEDVDTNKELVGHGYSNMVAGFFGTVPNYLVYVNTLLFYRVGGGTRIAGFMLALVTFLLLILGTGPIAYIPVMVVSALIFVLGIDLVKEAVWDTRHRVSRMEYITIISIIITMTVWDFVIGVLFGIVVSCFFFVVQNSQRRSIRACYTGDAAISTVRRPAAHRAYIRDVSRQTRIIRLQGFLFFGTISHVEDTLRSLVNDPTFREHPVRFVVVDFSLVAGVDLSAAEAFVRVQRLLAAKGVVLVFCGISRPGVGKALRSVGVLEEPYVELFETLNDAMEWTENAYLRAWFRAQKKETVPVVLPGRQKTVDFHEPLVGSPRRLHLKDAGERTMAGAEPLWTDVTAEPFNTLVKAFGSYDTLDHASLSALAPYFERVSLPTGFVLWEIDDPPNGLYIIESGVLRASYKFAEHTPVIEESMVSGTLAGELSALSGLPRNARVVVERDAVLWKLSAESLKQLEEEHSHLSQTFVRLVLKAAKVDTDTLLAALATR